MRCCCWPSRSASAYEPNAELEPLVGRCEAQARHSRRRCCWSRSCSDTTRPSAGRDIGGAGRVRRRASTCRARRCSSRSCSPPSTGTPSPELPPLPDLANDAGLPPDEGVRVGRGPVAVQEALAAERQDARTEALVVAGSARLPLEIVCVPVNVLAAEARAGRRLRRAVRELEAARRALDGPGHAQLLRRRLAVPMPTLPSGAIRIRSAHAPVPIGVVVNCRYVPCARVRPVLGRLVHHLPAAGAERRSCRSRARRGRPGCRWSAPPSAPPACRAPRGTPPAARRARCCRRRRTCPGAAAATEWKAAAGAAVFTRCSSPTGRSPSRRASSGR